MYRKSLAVVVLTLSMSGVALAAHCPKDAKAIDAALASTMMDDATKTKVMALRDEGMALHAAGDHRKSEATMAEAMRMLLMM